MVVVLFVCREVGGVLMEDAWVEPWPLFRLRGVGVDADADMPAQASRPSHLAVRASGSSRDGRLASEDGERSGNG